MPVENPCVCEFGEIPYKAPHGSAIDMTHPRIGCHGEVWPVSSLRLATNRSVKGEEEAQFHSVVCWDRLAETTATYVKKGDPLYVEGRLQYRSYQDEEGKERGICEVVADDVQFLGRRGKGHEEQRPDA